MQRRTLFTGSMKMAEVIGTNYDLVLLLPRFGIPLGFGEKNVREVCTEHGVDVNLFLTVCNIYTFDDYLPDRELVERIGVDAVEEHLRASHRYYIEERLPHLATHLQHVADGVGGASASLLRKYFDDYCKEVSDHVKREERHLGTPEKGESYSRSHVSIKDKLADLTQIIYKYLPGERLNEELMELVFDIMQLSRDLEKHAEIEELLIANDDDYSLSEREEQVLELVAQGLSSKQVAERLNIAVNTVNTHRKSITRKTGIKSVAGLAVYSMLKNK